MASIKIDDLAKAIAEDLANYTEEVTERVKDAVDVVAKEVNKEIKANVTFKQPSGDYVKAFRVKTIEETKLNKKKAWYVAKPHYRLTHLLEKGHALRNGGRSSEFPHIEYGEKLAKERMEQMAREAIKDAGR